MKNRDICWVSAKIIEELRLKEKQKKCERKNQAVACPLSGTTEGN